MKKGYNKDLVNLLLENIKNDCNDKESVIKLYNCMYQPIYIIALSNLNKLRPFWRQNLEDAKDIVGDTFTVILEKIDKFRYIKNGPGWIFKIAERRAKRFVYKRRHEHNLSQDLIDYRSELSLNNRVIVMDLLGRLSPREVKIITLHFQFNYTYKEVSAIVKKSQSGVKKMVARALKNYNNPKAL